jgi:TrmH family RNA methyltransferase
VITSPDNQHIKELRKLRRRAARERSGHFFAEGEDLTEAASAAGFAALFKLCPPGLGRGRDEWLEVDAGLLHQVSTIGSGTRAIAVYEQRWSEPCGPLCVYLHGVRDPGNVGTILRAAQAFGAASVALGAGCADPYGPKAVRASMGAIFAVPVARVGKLNALPGQLIALDPTAAEPLRGPPSGDASLLIGAEREGLPAEVLAACDRRCAIPLAAGDSLNAAMAATVALYEFTRVPTT